MKRYIRTNSQVSKKIQVIFDITFKESNEVAAATYKGFNIPEGELLPLEKDVIVDSQAYADFETFMESVEDLCADYYGLEIYYKNRSKDYSFYYGMLAKNSDGTLILDFEFIFRISNHPAHRSKQSRHNKAEREAILNELVEGKKRPQPITKAIIINKEEFTNYFDAYLAVDEIVKKVVSILERRKK